jgi:DNA polymerase III alpha subunit
MKGSIEAANFTPIQAEQIRKIIKSKKKEDFDKLKEQFIEGFVKKWTKK